MEYPSFSRKLFIACNYTFLIALAIICILPIIHILALSLSSPSVAAAGSVSLVPVDFNFKAYSYILNKAEFINAFGISVKRLILGTVLSMALTILTAYPLSKESNRFKSRSLYAWFFVLTIFISGGLIPWYMTIRFYGMLDTIWALVLPGAVTVFNVILLLNFFRNLPKELEESAFLDGAGHLVIMIRIFIPISMPAIATVCLFTMVNHWNSWFDGLILMNRTENYPLQTYLQTVVMQQDFSVMAQSALTGMQEISNRTVKSAQIFLGSLPILIVYPFLQRYFVKGIVLGSVKG
ncbi:carbohydrate ABC transporter permease [Paenibacillus sp. SYP-B4298]|uniref:carbohydrate ABC transporter permease n=1 Tax=Paenibacillus sp. SYP-B4298 TaxID=2996034 RepID=UPI0022DD11D8|nr:carbohydrate ABC transporter permease [Paenibacillus sp. SYP-B4298]